MMMSTRSIQVWAWPYPVDLRKSYNGLYALASTVLQKDPMRGEFFVFTNRLRTSCKVLHWDGTGLCIYMKRLARGRFAPLWRPNQDGAIELSAAELSLFLEGSKELSYRSLSVPPVT